MKRKRTKRCQRQPSEKKSRTQAQQNSTEELQQEENVWDSLDDLQEIMQLQAKARDDKVEFQKIMQHLFMNIVEPTQSKRKDQWAGARIDPLLLGLSCRNTFDNPPDRWSKIFHDTRATENSPCPVCLGKFTRDLPHFKTFAISLFGTRPNVGELYGFPRPSGE